MSEIIDNSRERKKKLKELILKLHAGQGQEAVRQELLQSLAAIPYGEVVEVEQELIGEGLPEAEVLKLCDAHSAVLHGRVDLSGQKEVPEGHPVDVFRRENAELRKLTAQARQELAAIKESKDGPAKALLRLRGLFNQLFDVDKHYQRKEYLLFPFLEKLGVTGPPKVMWGKHDEIRDLLKGGIAALTEIGDRAIGRDELLAVADILLHPALQGIDDMTAKEEEILLPMALDKLNDGDWEEISRQSGQFGYCLFDPPNWPPRAQGARVDETGISEADAPAAASAGARGDPINLPSGSFSSEELLAILNTLPVDMTFVDRNDKVKYFSQGSERIFQRNRAILHRDVRHCHPPASAHIVEKIIEDFKSGRESRAAFWIQMGGKFVHIEYFALRGEKGVYLGTLEVSHDVERYRQLKGERRILAYGK
ncbi:MAG: DUF438 domain-containing protein [Acidobacteria bacterium]|jgi:hypothetical protein|nr:DUF438 domain-containing protein [Acidobacteriota bacterium]